jgi:formylglycine-generating enzyme
MHVGIVALLTLSMDGHVTGAGENSRPANENSRPVSSAVQDPGQSAPDSLDCPFLPGCPGDTPVPLPPLLKIESKPNAPAPPSINGDNLVDGTGKYSGMVLIPAGPFDVGSAEGEGRLDERPIHKVFLKDFYIAKYDVTAKDFCAFLNAQGENSRDGLPRAKLDSPDCPITKVGKVFKPKEDCSDKPMVCVSWYGASDYAEWAGGRLPSSAEWEKAALLITSYHAGDYLTILPRESAVPVTIAVPGAKGVTGMTGNVWEWCSDWYSHDYYGESPLSNPMGPALGEEKNIRGGSWASPESAKRIRNRHKASPRGYYRTVGFRIVKD